jgi:hypothetical protein
LVHALALGAKIWYTLSGSVPTRLLLLRSRLVMSLSVPAPVYVGPQPMMGCVVYGGDGLAQNPQ